MELQDIFVRQASFIDCEVNVSTYMLAKNGFMFDKCTKIIKCISCAKVLDCFTTNIEMNHLSDCQFNSNDLNIYETSINIPPQIRNVERNVTQTIDPNIKNRLEPMNWTFYRNYDNRLKSFFDWPKNSIFDPKEFARCGFFYTGLIDKVACFSCHIKLSRWECADVILDEHLTHSPDCLFAQSLSITDKRKEPCNLELVSRKNIIPVIVNTSSEPPKEIKEPNYKLLYEDLKDKMLCSVCMIEERAIALLPCGHVLVCETCGRILQHCPLCRANIKGQVKIYLS